ncbi:MAG: hypothetical protein QM674_05920 [Burkholderiaceae bacterium]
MASITKTPAGTWRAQVTAGGVYRSRTFKAKEKATQWVRAKEAQQKPEGLAEAGRTIGILCHT